VCLLFLLRDSIGVLVWVFLCGMVVGVWGGGGFVGGGTALWAVLDA